MHEFKDQLAAPIRDRLNEIGYRAVIVEDEASLRGTFDPESKVNAYIEASDAFVALCTHDSRVPGATAQNIIDEIGRARTHPRLRDVVCVLKEANVILPSNVNPVWGSLDRADPGTAFGVIQRQLNAWGVVPTVSRATPKTATALPEKFLRDLFDGVGLGEHEKAEARLRSLYGQLSKEDQRRVAQGIFDLLIAAPENGGDVHVAGSFMEATARLDPALVPMEWVERLTESPAFARRMSAAMILWDLAETMPGIVPIDLVAKLAKPSTEDWYVYAPALAAAKQLSLTRKSALEILVDLARSLDADDRDAAVRALSDLARVDARAVPVEPVKRLAKDADPSVSDAAKLLLSTLSGITEDDRRYRYGKFGL